VCYLQLYKTFWLALSVGKPFINYGYIANSANKANTAMGRSRQGCKSNYIIMSVGSISLMAAASKMGRGYKVKSKSEYHILKYWNCKIRASNFL